MKTCEDCKFCVLQDVGYSNYTVEGTQVECRKSKHPDGDFDRFYGEDKRLEYADQCDSFEAGGAIDMDVDRENYEEQLTQEEKDIFDGKLP